LTNIRKHIYFQW